MVLWQQTHQIHINAENWITLMPIEYKCNILTMHDLLHHGGVMDL